MHEPQDNATTAVTQIWRYVVKGLGGERLPQVDLSPRGIEFDRALGISHDRVPLAPFGTWTTYEAFHALDARPDLGGHSARVEQSGAATMVKFTDPDGREKSVTLIRGHKLDDSNFNSTQVAARFGTETSTARLVNSGSHLWDFADASVSIINEATLRDIARVAGATVDARRFRANLYVDGLAPWAELDLVGRRFTIGAAEVEVMRPIERCRATSVDPDTGGTDINMPGILATFYGHLYCGVYARIIRPGLVEEGDVLTEVRGEPAPTRLIGVPSEYLPATPRSATVVDIKRATSRVVSVHLRDSIGVLPQALPGQHLRIHGSTEGRPWWRNYTISGTDDDRARITVQRRDDGIGSDSVHRLKAASRLLVTGPFGDATTASTSTDRLVLLTAGIGITPALAILRAFDSRGSSRTVDLVHVDRTLADVAHWSEVVDAVAGLRDARAHLFLTRSSQVVGDQRAGRPGAEFLRDLLSDAAHTEVHICGPTAFLQDMRRFVDVHGVRAENVHFDPFYTPRQDVPEPRAPLAEGPFRVTVSGGEETMTWVPASGTLLDLAESRGTHIPAGCRSGVCGTCSMTVEGDVFYVLEPMTSPPRGKVLTCCAVPSSDVTLS